MSGRGAALNNTTENKNLCTCCRDIADHWYEIAESRGLKGREPYSIRELLRNADSGCLLCRVVMDISGRTQEGLKTKKVDLEESVSFKVYKNHSTYEIVVSTLNHELGGEIKLFETQRSQFPKRETPRIANKTRCSHLSAEPKSVSRT
jgi:hypothetical protein